MEEQTISHPILYWFAITLKDGTLEFHLLFNGSHDIVNMRTAEKAMDNAKYLLYPIICLN